MRTWKRPRPPWLLLTLIATSACVTDSTAVVGDYCRIARPISYNTQLDTAETVKEIETHNSQWVCVCENDCPVGIDAVTK